MVRCCTHTTPCMFVTFVTVFIHANLQDPEPAHRTCAPSRCETCTWSAHSTSTKQVYSKASTVSITCIANDPAFCQMGCLHLTEQGRRMVQLIAGRTGTRAAERLQGLCEQLPELPSSSGAVWTRSPTWSDPEISCNCAIPGLSLKASGPDSVARSLAETPLESKYKAHLHISADGSSRSGAQSETSFHHTSTDE